MPNFLKSSKTADLTSTVQVLTIRIFAPKFDWLANHHQKYEIPNRPNWFHKLTYIMK